MSLAVDSKVYPALGTTFVGAEPLEVGTTQAIGTTFDWDCKLERSAENITSNMECIA